MRPEQVVDVVNRTFPGYLASKCPFHRHRSCFVVRSEGVHYHCLHDTDSKAWTRYPGTASLSHDLPFVVHLLHRVGKNMGERHVLPLCTHFRDPAGGCFTLHRLDGDNFGASAVDKELLASTFVFLLAALCHVSLVCGGATPMIGNMKFVYRRDGRTPILADVGKWNAGRYIQFRQKRWEQFLTQPKQRQQVLRFMRKCFPQHFARTRGTCLLQPGNTYDDLTHALICRTEKCGPGEIVARHAELFGQYDPDHLLSR